jgi:nucleoside-diphosphate-sugar epimerase
MECGVNHLLCFGFGFSAKALSQQLEARDWKISATSRTVEGVARINEAGFTGFLFDPGLKLPGDVTHLLVSAPPDGTGDPVLRLFTAQLEALRHLAWAGYLSTTGVYGDKGGDWVDEETPLAPNTLRGERRMAAEQAWLKLALPVHLFRLAGIYGPGRNQLLGVMNGTARRIIKQGQIFSRVHVEDIAGVLAASIARPSPKRAYNVCDDEPCPPEDVVAYAAKILGLPLPPEIPFSEAGLSPLARSFYADSKRVSNDRIKAELGYQLRYPNYRTGLAALKLELQAATPVPIAHTTPVPPRPQ